MNIILALTKLLRNKIYTINRYRYRRQRGMITFDSSGTISVRNDNWMIILIDADIGRYYLTRFNRSRPVLTGQVMSPKWGPHISLVRGEAVKNQELLSEIDGRIVDFRYSPIVRWDGRHAYLDAECQEALDIREQLGLLREPSCPLHVTVGVKMEL